MFHRPRRLHQEHDLRRVPDGRGHPPGGRGRRDDAANQGAPAAGETGAKHLLFAICITFVIVNICFFF